MTRDPSTFEDYHGLTLLLYLPTDSPQALALEAQVFRAQSDRERARAAESLAIERAQEAKATGDAVRANLEARERDLLEAKSRLDTAVVAESEIRGRCEELALASGAFAAEVARQKVERAKWQEHSRLAAASAAELRKRCAELVRASEISATERTRLERELSNARSESQEIDADVAQVLDALSSSERERRRLEGELERQSKIAGEARRAATLSEGAAANVQKEVNRERAELCERAGRLEGVVQVGASRLKESLEAEAKRRAELERESKALGSRVTDLEAALISASAEVRKAAKLAAVRGATHERQTTALNEEISRLKSALRVETANARESLERATEERGKWAEDKLAMQQDAARERAMAAETGSVLRKQHRNDLAGNRERQEYEIASLRKEVAEMAETLKVETARVGEASAREASVRATAAREVAVLQQKVDELEGALATAIADVNHAVEAERESARRLYHMQADIRSVAVLAPAPNHEEAPGEVINSYRRQPLASRWGKQESISSRHATGAQEEVDRGIAARDSDFHDGPPVSSSLPNIPRPPVAGEDGQPNSGNVIAATEITADDGHPVGSGKTWERTLGSVEEGGGGGGGGGRGLWASRRQSCVSGSFSGFSAKGNDGTLSSTASSTRRYSPPPTTLVGARLEKEEHEEGEGEACSSPSLSSRGIIAGTMTSGPTRASTSIHPLIQKLPENPTHDTPEAGEQREQAMMHGIRGNGSGNREYSSSSAAAGSSLGGGVLGRRDCKEDLPEHQVDGGVGGEEAERPVSPLSSPMTAASCKDGGGGGGGGGSCQSSSLLQSTTSNTSGTSSSLLPNGSRAVVPRRSSGNVVARGCNVVTRTGSLVVCDWKAGQREAFSALDRKAPASSHKDGVASGGAGWR